MYWDAISALNILGTVWESGSSEFDSVDLATLDSLFLEQPSGR